MAAVLPHAPFGGWPGRGGSLEFPATYRVRGFVKASAGTTNGECNLKKCFILAVLLLGCAAASAQGVYKWTDANGKVHYGDQGQAPGNSTTIKTPLAPAGAAAAGAAGATAAAAGDLPNLSTCLQMARTMADDRNPTPAGIRAQSQQLLSLCPITAYQCKSYLRQPERNSCDAVPMSPGGQILTHRTYN